MQCLPQYNAENSVTNQLAKQLKKTKVVSQYLLHQCSSAINNVSSSAFLLRLALGAQFPHRVGITFATQTTLSSRSEGYSKTFADRCRSCLTLKMSNATLSKHFIRRKCGLFTFTKRVSHRTMNALNPIDSRDLRRPTDLPFETLSLRRFYLEI